MVKLLKTSQDNDAIALDGHIYTLKSSSLIKKIWRCFNRGCNAKIHTPIDFEIELLDDLVIRGTHICRQIPEIIKRMENRGKIRSQALLTDNRTRYIINDVLSLQNQSNIFTTGSQHSLEQVIGRARRKSFNRVNAIEPALNIGEDMMVSLRGNTFYQFGPNFLRNLEDSANFAVFFNQSLVDFFKESAVWSIDGTFSVCPQPWVQLYTISVIIDHHVVPIVFGLLKNKSRIIYDKFLSVIRRLIPNLRPAIIMSDFEKAAIDSFSATFPNAKLSGCLFHLAQNVQKKIKSLGLSPLY
jgi:hypothetical protein